MKRLGIKHSKIGQRLIKAFLLLFILMIIFIVGQTYSFPYVTSIGVILFPGLAGLIAPASKEGGSAGGGGDYS
jgi:hypothetical protein